MTTSISKLPSTVEQYRLTCWDRGVFTFELLKLDIIPTKATPFEIDESSFDHTEAEAAAPEEEDETPDSAAPVSPANQGVIEGTYHGTQMAITEIFNLIEQRYGTYYDVVGIDSILPRPDSVEIKRTLYTWAPLTKEKNNYPPHCDHVPKDQGLAPDQIFDRMGLKKVKVLVPKLIPNSILGFVGGLVLDPLRYKLMNTTAKGAKSINDIWEHNKKQRSIKATAYEQANVGDRKDWYSDAVFAQQQFVGTNPTTITVIDDELLAEFLEVASDSKNYCSPNMFELLKTADRKSLYVQDCRYFRKAIGFTDPAAPMKNNKNSNKSSQWRYACAPVSLFHLEDDGKLHPLAIVIDYKKSMKESVTLFNKRERAAPLEKEAKEQVLKEEEVDWPWRYAKTCCQVADWIRHEIAIHLTHTHLIEEAIIVATQRTFAWDHIIIRILFPHWYKTLALNQAARDVLLPAIILDLIGFTEDQAFNFINYSYNNFNWTGQYVPEDLKNRGFPTDKLEDADYRKFRNYGYANNIYPLWKKIKSFVTDMLSLFYKSNEQVASDEDLKAWCSEIRGKYTGRIGTFPEKFNTIDELADAVTMCIHIASPQHTAVNYLQQYYQSFVINKPAALCQPLPTDIDKLKSYKESDLMAALPLDRAREWLLMSHLPYLLSFRVSENNSLASYVGSLYNLNMEKTAEEDQYAPAIKLASAKFFKELYEFDQSIPMMNAKMDDVVFPYDVLDPDHTAVSILI